MRRRVASGRPATANQSSHDAHPSLGRTRSRNVSSLTGQALVSFQVQGIGFADRPDLYGFALLLGYLGMVTFATVRQAMRVVATRRAPETLRTPVHEALAWVSIAGSVAVIAFALGVWSDISPILLALGPVGLFTGSSMLRLMRKPGARHMGWFYSHLGSMLGGGVAFHTTFIVFGARRLWAYEPAGPLAIVPWIGVDARGAVATVREGRAGRQVRGRRADGVGLDLQPDQRGGGRQAEHAGARRDRHRCQIGRPQRLP